jgi:hypothetical protein
MNQKIQSLLGVSTITFVVLLSLFFINSSQKLAIVPQQQLAQLSSSLSTGLVAHYTFDDTTNDSAGSNHGTAVGGPTYVVGKIGRALSFDGVDDYLDLGSSSSLDTSTGNFFITAWIYPETMSADRAIIKRGTYNSTSYVQHQFFLTPYINNNIVIGIGDGATQKYSISASNSITLNAWNFIAAGIDSNNNIVVYINGVQSGTPTANTLQLAIQLT